MHSHCNCTLYGYENILTLLFLWCEQRDQTLQLLEGRMEKEKQDLQREADRKVTEMEDTCRRVREEYVHQCALENARLRDVQAENAQLRERHADCEEKLRQVESPLPVRLHAVL
jgi:hypothetical protein